MDHEELREIVAGRLRSPVWASIVALLLLAGGALWIWRVTPTVVEVRSGGERALAGWIAGLDADRWTLRLADGLFGRAGEEIAVAPTTLIRVGAKEGGFGDLAVGLRVALVATPDAGRWVSRTILVGVDPSREQLTALLAVGRQPATTFDDETTAYVETLGQDSGPRPTAPRSAPPLTPTAPAPSVAPPLAAARSVTTQQGAPAPDPPQQRPLTTTAADRVGSSAAPAPSMPAPAAGKGEDRGRGASDGINLAAAPARLGVDVHEVGRPASAPPAERPQRSVAAAFALGALAAGAPVHAPTPDARRGVLGFWYVTRNATSATPDVWRFARAEPCRHGTCYLVTENGAPAMAVTETGALADTRDASGAVVASFDPPVPVVASLPRVGARWSQRTRVSTASGTRTVTFAGEVVAREPVRTPAGIFEAYRVRVFEDWTLVRELWFSPRLAAPLRVHVFTPDGARSATELAEHDRGNEPVVQARLDRLFDVLGKIAEDRRTGRITEEHAERLKRDALRGVAR